MGTIALTGTGMTRGGDRHRNLPKFVVGFRAIIINRPPLEIGRFTKFIEILSTSAQQHFCRLACHT